jgi:arylsulfatase A-like enzyme
MSARKPIERMKSRLFASVLLLTMLPMVAPAASQATRPPNIIFILADDLGYGDLGCYGQKDIQTPNLDRLATQSMRFTQAYTGASVCAPSRCVLMTGLHTGHARVRENMGTRKEIPPEEHGQKDRIPLLPEDVTVAQVLKEAGYATAIYGKWGLGEPGSTGLPTRHGFDDWFGFLNQDAAVFYYPSNLWANEVLTPIPGNQNGQRNTYVQDLFTEHALGFIKQNQAKPFFLYLAYTTPHPDYEVPSFAQYADKPWSNFEKTYAAMVSRLDGDVGRVMALLAELHLEDDTLLIFTSDNGAAERLASSRFHSTPDFRGRKGEFYEGGIRTPMLVRWPGKIPSGVVSSQVWYFADFLPTATELAGAKTPAGLDGISIVPTLLGKPQDLTQRVLYWENRRSRGARQGNWKVVRPALSQPLELYDVSVDLGETNNLAAQHPEIIAQFEAYMKSAHTPSPYYSGSKKDKRVKTPSE